MPKIIYNGFEIVPAPYHRIKTNNWSLRVQVTKIFPKPVSKTFDLDLTFDTKEEATRKSIEFGKQIIEGKHHGIDISDL